MKNALTVLVFTLFFGFSFGQTTGNQIKVEKKELKAVDKNQSTEGKNNHTETKTEPEIILHLEYNAVEPAQTNAEEKIAEVVPAVELIEAKTIDQEITEVDAMINSIDSKIEWVKNNPEENKKAKASGWFDQMEGYKQTAQLKKEELLKLKK